MVDHVLRNGPGKGIQAIVVYPMNALANSQGHELGKFLRWGFPDLKGPVSFARYTGQESDEQREEIIGRPPDILLTNYVMLELILTRPGERRLVDAARGLQFFVLDELHTYRGRQGADVALLVRRVREATASPGMQCVGTSATLAGAGKLAEQQVEIARVASTIFGAEVKPESVIGETLQRATRPDRPDDPAFVAALRERLADRSWRPPETAAAFADDPLASWIETTFGLATEPSTGRLVRATPIGIEGPDGAAARLAELTGASPDRCAEAIRATLETGVRLFPEGSAFPIFAFRIHQFFGRGDTVYASLEPEDRRHVTTQGQQFVPGDRSRILLPLAFCRECGQEYYTVARDGATPGGPFEPRDVGDTVREPDVEKGFLYLSAESPWPDDPEAQADRVPAEWTEARADGSLRIRSERQADVPRTILVGTDGREAPDGTRVAYVKAPFRFCLRCGVTYGARQTRDLGKLTTLGVGGRSSATSVLCLTAIRSLRNDTSLEPEARKLLSFTDNRQDASLQAGHFNDFVEVGLLRSALHRAALAAGSDGLSHDVLTIRVTAELGLDPSLYARDPDVRFAAREETERALRDVVGYRLYRDLERGWRVTAPNLEQSGLLEIHYLSLDELCAAEDVWASCHPALARSSPEQRREAARAVLDHLRRELAIDVDYLDPLWQDSLKQRSGQHLIPPWAIDEEEQLVHAAVAYPRPSRPTDYGGDVFLSARGGVGLFLRRPGVLASDGAKLTLSETEKVIRDLLEALRAAGLLTVVRPADEPGSVPGYRLKASAMRWVAGTGEQAFRDLIRVPRAAAAGQRTNPYFVRFYREVAADGAGIAAREHTAQVPPPTREEREQAFREGRLPILFCSPTMELGVDIAELNVVNMRNVPPTPANYAQRSGRAGRSGRPALVFNYCTTGSPHDQYFFRRP
ncbi:MAG TPA: DEAD/DEAH box helicase, partial [Candidatus Limnocylindrales bacterium]|nr:DEAD/DEAH box helicase [Candidatus Limnocylindrales bacterium]